MVEINNSLSARLMIDPDAIVESLCNGRTKPARILSWFYILRPFVFSNCTWIVGLHQDCNRIVDCDLC